MTIPSELGEVISLYVKGSQIKDISKLMGITPNGLYSRLFDAGIKLSELEPKFRCVQCGEEFKGKNHQLKQVRCPECQAIRLRMMQLKCNDKRRMKNHRKYDGKYAELKTIADYVHDCVYDYVHACVECGGKTMLATENEYYSASEMCCTSCGLVEGG